jgi:lipoprotein-anchoring transpeptidase ErfK/SrfK
MKKGIPMKLRTLVAVSILVLAAALTSLAPSAAGAATRPRVVALTSPLVVRTPVGAAITVFDGPRASTPSRALEPTTVFGSARVLLATARKGSWYQVSLPTRPNGSTGWVRARDVSLHRVRDDVRVDLAARTLTWTRDGTVVLATPVAIGAPDTPTPSGAFYLTDLLDNADDFGPYGPLSIGTSAHSDQLTDFAGGDGQIGIHGTNDPGSIGHAVSHGCVRVPNDVVTVLAHSLPLGTPVTIG